jgi:DNA (cytosine-5)-methyltransferase 1
MKAGLSTREISATLARWFRKQSSVPAMPWLKTDNRWKFVLGELLLDRATSTVVNAVWPIIDSQHDLRPGGFPDGAAIDLLDELMSGVGRGQRISAVRQLVTQVTAAPTALWQPTIDRTVLPGIPTALTDLMELALPNTEDGLESEEPVLITKGVLRVASRFQGNDADKRNVQTDGRVAVAGMIGFGDDSRPAHLGLIALAAELCLVEKPLCGDCPLSQWCAAAGG